MRKIILFIAASLDCYIARKDGGIDWLFIDADYGYKKFYAGVDTLIVGANTYRQAQGWKQWPFAGKKCFVMTRQKKMKKDSRVEFAANALSLARKLKKEKGKNIWLVGGSQIISVLANAGLVDELVLSIHPVVLGQGIPLFADMKKEKWLELGKVKSFKSGLVQLSYKLPI